VIGYPSYVMIFSSKKKIKKKKRENLGNGSLHSKKIS
jgi:hypothetical protein